MNNRHNAPPIPRDETEEKPPAYLSDAGPTFRASAFGGCNGVLVDSLRNEYQWTPELRTLQFFNEGHLHEPDVVARVAAAADLNLTAAQKVLELPVPGGLVTGHVDEYGADNDGASVVVEAKAVGAERYDEILDSPPDTYLFQTGIYVLAAKADHAILGVKNRDTGEVNWIELSRADLPSKDAIDMRAGELIDAFDSDTQVYCSAEHPFWCECSHARSLRADVGDDSIIMTAAAAEYLTSQRLRKQADAIKDAATEKFELIRDWSPKERIVNKLATISYVEEQRPSMRNVRDFMETYPDIAEQYVTISERNYFRVTGKR